MITRMSSRFFAAFLFALAGAVPLIASPAAIGGLAGGIRVIVILNRAYDPSPDVATLGGRIVFRQDEHVEVDIPADAVAELRKNPHVRIIQATAGTSLPPRKAGHGNDPEKGLKFTMRSTASPK